jgi:galactonate dehydratase
MLRRQFFAGAALFAAARSLSIRKLTTRKHTIGKRDYLFVEIETDGGITGIGEGSISGRVDIVEQAIQWFTPHLTGRNPGGIEDHWNRAYYQLSRYRDGSVLMTALAAIDIALWDIEGNGWASRCGGSRALAKLGR